ncbi:MarR family winged helix-turn-helix transcriptional regulator [Anaerorhabdus sp.]|jgi:DNA-binding MarR family transcriptional regulator|uniref:MarR family winged helix-turn-helix transcriptional regulator n=1 Tax=Anaerorhabdus sp. TaxID=1872524 RepID=UPI002FC91E8F
MNKNLLLVGRYFNKLYENYCESVCIKYELTQIELDVIAFLANNPSLDTASDIVEVRKLTKSNVSAAIEQLIQRKLIKREADKNDRRKIHLVLLASTKVIVKDIRAAQDKFSDAITYDFTEEEKVLFGEFVNRMLENILGGIEREKKNGK